MIKEEFKFKSSDGKTNIHCIKWLPNSKKYKAILQLVHGMIEYIERYEGLAEFLTDNQIMVVGHDQLGHGESVVDEDSFGYFSKEHPSDILVKDIHTLRTEIQKDNFNVPYFILGHSMGSYMLRKYIAKYAQGLSGVIICGTGYSPLRKNNAGLMFLKMLKVFKGDRYRSQLAINLTYDKSYQKFDLTGRNKSNSWLTRDESVVANYYTHKWCTFLFTVNGLQGLLEAVKFDCIQENIDCVPRELPIYFLSGDDDPVGSLGEGVKKVYSMFKKSGRKDIKMKLYPGFRHEIVNEIGKEEVYHDIYVWINARI